MSADDAKPLGDYPAWAMEKLHELRRLALHSQGGEFCVHLMLLRPDDRAAAKRAQRLIRSIRKALRIYSHHPLAALEREFYLTTKVTWDAGGGVVRLWAIPQIERCQRHDASLSAIQSALGR